MWGMLIEAGMQFPWAVTAEKELSQQVRVSPGRGGQCVKGKEACKDKM